VFKLVRLCCIVIGKHIGFLGPRPCLSPIQRLYRMCNWGGWVKYHAEHEYFLLLFLVVNFCTF